MGSTGTSRTTESTRLVRNPAAATLGVLAVTAAVFFLLREVTTHGAESKDGKELVAGAPFQAWTLIATIAVVSFGKVLRDGVIELRREPLSKAAPSPAVLALYYAGFAALALFALRKGGRGGPKVPLENWHEIVWGLLAWGAVSAGPWVVAVWAAHSLLHDKSRTVSQLRPLGEDDAAEPLDAQLQELRRFRGVVVRAVTRLLTIVLAATLMSGALRAAIVPRYVSETDLPNSAILLYGAFFTGVLATAVVPLMARWRSLARALVERAYPFNIDDTADEASARERLLKGLDVNGSLFTFPVTLSALLAPLITSLLSVYVPQLGK
jgi:hypothetical protein